MTAPTTRETADHAELARRLRVSWSDRGWVASNKIKELLGEAREAADALEALLSEIAALRGDLTVSRDDLDQLQAHFRQRDREATQAERQRDDMAKALLSLAEGNLGDEPWQASYETIKQVARNALANQGADQ